MEQLRTLIQSKTPLVYADVSKETVSELKDAHYINSIEATPEIRNSLYAYLLKDVPHAEYMNQCYANGFEVVSLAPKLKLIEFLESQPQEQRDLIRVRVLVNRNSQLQYSFPYKQILSKQHKKSEQQSKQFIIILPQSMTSLITAQNAFDFLQNGEFKPSSTTPSMQATDQTITRGDRQFKLVSDPQQISKSQWSQVVAVFATGQAWQFKEYLYQDPTVLFNKVQGFHLKYAEDVITPQISQWKVCVLEVSRYKRHLDATCLLRFWAVLESFISNRR